MQKTSTWFRLPAELLCNKELSTSTKIVYCYMLSRYQYFSRTRKNYFESQESIAKACALSRKTVNEAISELQKNSYIEVNMKSKTTLHYVLRDCFGVYEKESSNCPWD